MKIKELVEEKLSPVQTKLKEGKEVEWILFLCEFYPGFSLEMDVLDFIAKLVELFVKQRDELFELMNKIDSMMKDNTKFVTV